jgi:hypothetical protein
LIAMAIMLVVAGAVFGLTGPAQATFQTTPERADMQQRLRIGIEAISKDLMMSGAGGQVTGGTILPGRSFATIVPRRRGLQSPDPPDVFVDDRISIMYVPPAAATTTLSADTGSTVTIPLRPQPGCPSAEPLCGFHANQLVSIFDGTGAHDEFRVISTSDPLVLVGAGPPLSKLYLAGATVAEVVSATYWLRTDAAANVHQLMRYDGRQTDSPLAEDVMGLRFQYFGDPSPPVLRRQLDDLQGPWTSYGPVPPPIEIDDPSTPGYGAGENCMFTVDRGTTVTRAEMIDLGSSASSLVPLDARQLTDGPWCPDPASPVRFDADLLRIRLVRITLRVRASRTFVFTRIPDLDITFDVAPRNLQP